MAYGHLNLVPGRSEALFAGLEGPVRPYREVGIVPTDGLKGTNWAIKVAHRLLEEDDRYLMLEMKVARRLSEGTLVVIFPDGRETYMTTPLFGFPVDSILDRVLWGLWGSPGDIAYEIPICS